MNFESELKKGSLVVSRCSSCKITVWPPSEFCSKCLKETVWEKGPATGVVLEFSKKGEEYFCMVEMEGSFRILGKIRHGVPRIGQRIRIQRCGIKDGSYFFEMQIL